MSKNKGENLPEAKESTYNIRIYTKEAKKKSKNKIRVWKSGNIEIYKTQNFPSTITPKTKAKKN